MATVYSVATDDDDITGYVRDRLRSHHQEMAELGVRVGVLWAENEDGDALTHGGYPAAAKIKVVPQRDRITKGYDAELLVDRKWWEDESPRRRRALVAHELRHLKLAKKDIRGAMRVQYDDNGRPKLKTVPGDWNGGDGFYEIVREFGADAVEYLNALSVWAKADGAERAGPELDLFTPAGRAGADDDRQDHDERGGSDAEEEGAA